MKTIVAFALLAALGSAPVLAQSDPNPGSSTNTQGNNPTNNDNSTTTSKPPFSGGNSGG